MQYITLIMKNYHLIISIDAEKTLVKIQHPIMRTKAQREQTSTNILNRETESTSCKFQNDTRIPTLKLLFNIVLKS